MSIIHVIKAVVFFSFGKLKYRLVISKEIVGDDILKNRSAYWKATTLSQNM